MMGSMMRRAMIGDSATLNVDFTSMTNGGQLANAGFTFTNATTTARTYINSNGVLATATTNEPRFDHDPTTLAPRGLLVEGTSTNLLLQSGDWNTTWNNPAPITWDGTTYTTAPDGTNTAKQITVTAGSSSAIGQAVATGTNRTMSVWLKAGSLTSFSIGAFDAGGTAWGNNADSTCSKISGPGSVTQQTGGLWSITGLSTTQWTRIQLFRSTTYTTFLAYPGSSSGTINGTAFMWGMQMEAGNGASSLIPTGASQVQRLADSAVMNDIAPLNYSATNGSIYWSGIINKQPTSYITLVGFMTAIDQPAYETFGNALNYFTAARGPTLNIGGSNEVSRTYVLGSLIKYASSVNTLQDPIVAVNLNGSASSTNKSGTGDLRVATRFVIGRQPSSTYGAEYPSVTIRSIKYWPTSKVAAELAVLTA